MGGNRDPPPSAVPYRLLIGATTALLLGARVVGLALGVAVYASLARTLRPAELGTFALALTLVQTGATVVDFGANALQVRESEAHPHREAALLGWLVRARTVAGFAMFAVGAVVAPMLVPPADLAAVLVVLATLPFGGLMVGLTTLQRHRRLGTLAWLLLLQSALWLAVVVTAGALDASLLVLAIGHLATTVAFGAAAAAAGRRMARPDPSGMSLREFRTLMRGGGALTAVAVLTMAYFKLDTVLVYAVTGAGAAGMYAVAYRVLEQAAVVPVTLSNVYNPLVAGAAAQGGSVALAFQGHLRATLLVAPPLVVVGVLASEDFVGVVFGPRYAPAAGLLRLLLPAFVPSALGYVVAAAAIATRQTSRQVGPSALAVAMTVGLDLALLPHHGPKAAAAVTVATEVVYVAVLYLAVRRRAGLTIPWRWVGRVSTCVAVPAVAAGVLVPHRLAAAGAYAVAYGALVSVSGVLREVPPAAVGRTGGVTSSAGSAAPAGSAGGRRGRPRPPRRARGGTGIDTSW